jgi:hypothetical protein
LPMATSPLSTTARPLLQRLGLLVITAC